VDAPVDGNALAGMLLEALGADLTASEVTCAGCSRTRVVADLVVYDRGPGVTARCRGCGDVVLRVARIRSELVVDIRGTGLPPLS